MNRNRSLILVIFMIVVKAVSGQDYFTGGATPDLHILHKVAAKETWYSIARNFNLTPKAIATYNKLNISTPLEIGQPVKIPLTSSNFSQNDVKGKEGFVPVYHVVQEKEWLYRISVNHNKVPLEKLEKWNNITRDEAKAGTKLVVGYLKVKDANADNASNGSVSDNTEVAKQEPAAKKEIKEEIKKNETVVVSPTQTYSSKDGGYFKSQYDENGKNYSAVSGIFKSTSGWNDGKYYALMNNVTVGTIVKVNNPQTNKFIYAKVLGELPDMKESAGLSLRISDAAAKEIGAVNNKFSVAVNY